MTPAEIRAEVARWLPPEVRCETDRGTVTLDVPAREWVAALTLARDTLGCDYFDWLGGVDEEDDGFAVVVHLYSLAGRHHLLVRTQVPREEPTVATASGVYRGATWHERETHEMFGVVFEGHLDLAPLLLPGSFEGHPLRKDFMLAARAAKEWPGDQEPGEPGEPSNGARTRRRVPPPGVPGGWRRAR